MANENRTFAIAIAVALIETAYEPGKRLTDEEIEKMAIKYHSNDSEPDEIMLGFEDQVWSDELEEKYSDIMNDGHGYYIVRK